MKIRILVILLLINSMVCNINILLEEIKPFENKYNFLKDLIIRIINQPKGDYVKHHDLSGLLSAMKLLDSNEKKYKFIIDNKIGIEEENSAKKYKFSNDHHFLNLLIIIQRVNSDINEISSLFGNDKEISLVEIEPLGEEIHRFGHIVSILTFIQNDWKIFKIVYKSSPLKLDELIISNNSGAFFSI